MSDIVPAEDIERIVGAPRHAFDHLACAVSFEQTVYILHSSRCLDATRRLGRDLRDCPFSLALDNGIEGSAYEWAEDVTVKVEISDDGDLVPLPYLGAVL